MTHTPACQKAADGVRWNDLAFGIVWPLEPTKMSEQKATGQISDPRDVRSGLGKTNATGRSPSARFGDSKTPPSTRQA